MPLTVSPQFSPVLDPGFVPAVLWNRAYAAEVAKDSAARRLDLALIRADGTAFRWSGRILSADRRHDALTIKFVERLVKFLLWQKGGSRILVAGAADIAASLSEIYSANGLRKFDREFIGTKIFGEPISVTAVASSADLPE